MVRVACRSCNSQGNAFIMETTSLLGATILNVQEGNHEKFIILGRYCSASTKHIRNFDLRDAVGGIRRRAGCE